MHHDDDQSTTSLGDTYDHGGMLHPASSRRLNATGRPIRVLTAEQLHKLTRSRATRADRAEDDDGLGGVLVPV